MQGEITPVVIPLAEVEDGLTDETRELARDQAFEILRAYRDNGCPQLTVPDDAMVEEAMHYVTGIPIPEEQLDLMREELNLLGEDRRQVHILLTSVNHGGK